MTKFQHAFLQQQLFSSSFALDHNASDLIANCNSPPQINYICGAKGKLYSNNTTKETNHQHLLTHVPLGKRFPNLKVVNQSDARSWHFFRWLQASGRFHIVLFAGDVSNFDQMQRVHNFAGALGNLTSLLRRCILSGKKILSLVVFSTIHFAARQGVELLNIPEPLHPFVEEMVWNNNRIFVDDESYNEGHGQAYLPRLRR